MARAVTTARRAAAVAVAPGGLAARPSWAAQATQSSLARGVQAERAGPPQASQAATQAGIAQRSQTVAAGRLVPQEGLGAPCLVARPAAMLVASADWLALVAEPMQAVVAARVVLAVLVALAGELVHPRLGVVEQAAAIHGRDVGAARSEKRRVGKECVP